MAKRGERPADVFVCGACGNEYARWSGRCPGCGEWNSLQPWEQAPTPVDGKPPVSARWQPLRAAAESPAAPTPTGLPEVDRVLGGGLVPGALVLLGGEPGIGKSTLALQIAASPAGPAWYLAGEESPSQVATRARRLGLDRTDVHLATGELSAVLEAAAGGAARALVVDSLQTVTLAGAPGTAGTPGHLRAVAQALLGWAKEASAAVLLVGHVTKDGEVAGPRTVEHLVDVVLYLEGERGFELRLLRCVKNRFGSADEVGVCRMTAGGLVPEPDLSRLLLAERPAGAAGSAVTAAMEGTRPVLVEVQALVTPSALAVPRRVATGVDTGRLLMLCAVLSQRARVPLGQQDVLVNVAGGMRVTDPAIDLAVAVSIASAERGVPVPDDVALLGEVGLAGELRRPRHVERRLAEAARCGYRRVVLPASARELATGDGLTLVPARTLAEALRRVLGDVQR